VCACVRMCLLEYVDIVLHVCQYIIMSVFAGVGVCVRVRMCVCVHVCVVGVCSHIYSIYLFTPILAGFFLDFCDFTFTFCFCDLCLFAPSLCFKTLSRRKSF